MSTIVGKSLGRYHILEQLGEGGMATVYKAFDTRLERDVAIKIIRRGAFPEEQLERILARFEREAKSLAKLSHPNIVKVYDYGEHAGSPYLVLEFLSGGTLKQKLGQPLPWQEALTLMQPIVDALAYAHERKIVHRDIKPSNVLLTEKGQPLLTDFGIAKILDWEDGQTLTGTGVGVGTPEYMAPEQGMGKEIDTRADVYALGVVLYELLTGKKPYTADTPMAVVLKHVTDPLPRPRQLAPSLPNDVEKLLLKTLAKQPIDRYQSMDELAVAIRLLLERSMVGSDVSTQRMSHSRTNPLGPSQMPKNLDVLTSDTLGMSEAANRPNPNSGSGKPNKWWKIVTIGIIIGFLGIGTFVIDGLKTVNEQPVYSTISTMTPTSLPVSSPTSSIVEIPTSPVNPVQLNGQLVIWANDASFPVLQKIAPKVLQESNINLDVVLIDTSDIGDKFEAAALAGNGPDILFGLVHDRAGQLITNNLLAEVNLSNKTGEFSRTALDACTIDSVLFCMPYATENLGFIYNTALVETAPKTWAEVISMGETLKAQGKITYVMSIAGTTYDLYPLYTSFGGYIFGQTANGDWNDQDLGLDSPGMIAAAEFIRVNVNNGNLPTDWDWSSNHALFESGKTAFLMAGPWALSRIDESGVPYAVADYFPSGPAGPGIPFAGTQGIYINASSNNIQLAQFFLTEYIATEEVMMDLYINSQRPSAYLPVLAKTDNPALMAMGRAGANASMMPAIPAMGFVWSNWNDAIVLVRDGKQDAKTALATAATNVRALINNTPTGMVNIPGSYQDIVGCSGIWQPECPDTVMSLGSDGLWRSGPFMLPAGYYEFKVAFDGSWTTNYGNDGKQDGPNYAMTLRTDSEVVFVFDPKTKLVEVVLQ